MTPNHQPQSDPLLAEQRRLSDEYRIVEKEFRGLRNLMATRNVEITDRASMEADAVARTIKLTELNRRMAELDVLMAAAPASPGSA